MASEEERQLELETLFGQGLSEETGDLVPLPAMPLLRALPSANEESVATEVEKGRVKQRETRELPKVAPQLDDLRVGDEVPVPGGGLARITWIDPKRKRVAVGEGKSKTFVSLAEIEKLSGRKVADDFNRKRSEENRQEERTEAPEPVVLPADLPKGLYPHQLENVAFLTKYGRGLIADEMGLGKTISAAVCVEAPAVVVCPSLLKVNWSRELAKWKPEMTVTMVSGTDPDAIEKAQKRADVVVINYDILHAHVDWLVERGNRTIVSDESHYLKNLAIRWNKVSKSFEVEKSSPRRASAFYKLQRGVDHLYLLTGTPILNRAKELFPILHMLDPKTWGSGYQYCMRYCAGHYEFLKVRGGSRKVFNCNGRSNSEELHDRVHGRYMMRHTKEAELKNLPPKRRSSITVSLSPKYAVIYRKARNDFLRWVEEQGGPEAVARAQQAQALVQLTKLRAIAAVGKADAAVNYIIDFWESTRRPLGVMGVHRDAFDMIAAGLDAANEEHRKAVEAGRMPEMSQPIRYGMVVGGMGERARQDVIDGFQTKGTIDVILYSIPIATGTTLTRASDALFLERMWRPADQLQAEDRFHRIGQENHVSIVYMDAEGTIDLKLGHLLMEKAETAAAIIDGHNLTAEESSGLVFGEMFGLLEDVGDVKPNRRVVSEEESTTLVRGPAPQVFGADGERFDAYEDELVPNRGDDVYETYVAEGLIADSWGDPL